LPYKDKNKNKIYHKEYMRKWRLQHPEKEKDASKAKLKLRQKRKEYAVELKGGRCSNPNCACPDGYRRNLAALEFHHPDGKKEHWSKERNFLRYSYDKFIKELEIVVLLCSNCHQEIHHPELTK
jgi:hypothetical protein